MVRKRGLPWLGLFDVLVTTSLSIPVSFFDGSHAPSSYEVVGQTDHKFVVVGGNDIGHRLNNASKKLEDKGCDRFILVESLQD